MSVAGKIAGELRTAPPPSERVVAAFPATSHNKILMAFPAALAGIGVLLFDRYATSTFWVVLPLLTLIPVVWFLLTNQNYTVIATDERTVVGHSSTFSVLKVEEIVDELAVEIIVGPTSGLLHRTHALGRPMLIHRSVFDEVSRADER